MPIIVPNIDDSRPNMIIGQYYRDSIYPLGNAIQSLMASAAWNDSEAAAINSSVHATVTENADGFTSFAFRTYNPAWINPTKLSGGDPTGAKARKIQVGMQIKGIVESILDNGFVGDNLLLKFIDFIQYPSVVENFKTGHRLDKTSSNLKVLFKTPTTTSTYLSVFPTELQTSSDTSVTVQEKLVRGAKVRISTEYKNDINDSVLALKSGLYMYGYIFTEFINSSSDVYTAPANANGYKPYSYIGSVHIMNESTTDTTLKNFWNITGIEDIVVPVNPDEDADNTYPGGGNDQNQYPEDGTSGKGTFDNRNDPIDFPDMPVMDATSTGFISLWNPTITEITELYGFLWDSDISTTLKKLFLEPMDAIISLAFFPVEPTLFSGGKRNVTIGHVDTEITMNAVQKQFVDFDFGELEVDEYYGAAWDYSPYTHASIYLPYIGVQAIDIDDVMKGSLHLKYRIDLLSGMCSAMLKVDRSRDGLGAIIYTWQGNCAMFVPVTAGSAREFINSIIQIGAMAGVSMAQPAAGAIEARANRDVEDYKAPSLGGNWINPAMSAYSTLNVLGQKVHVQRGGRVDSNAGVMSPQQAYIILSRPVSAIPKGWNKYAGYPSLKIKKLSTQKGYTEIAYIKLNNLEATAEEISELNSILRGGVIL